MVYALWTVRAVVAAVFVYSALGKLRSTTAWQAFRRAAVDLTPPALRRVAPILAVLTVGAELAVAVLMVPGGPWVVAGLALAGVLLIAFTAALLLALKSGHEYSCACFGNNDAIGWRHVVRNAVLLTLVGVALLSMAAPPAPATSAGIVVSFVIAGVVAFLVVAVDYLHAALSFNSGHQTRSR